jgi:hypothetical protein
MGITGKLGKQFSTGFQSEDGVIIFSLLTFEEPHSSEFTTSTENVEDKCRAKSLREKFLELPREALFGETIG